MQDNMQQAQEEIKQLTATGNAGGGSVKVSINGEHQATDIQIDASSIASIKALASSIPPSRLRSNK
jgi:DNA-binding protein YbaB